MDWKILTDEECIKLATNKDGSIDGTELLINILNNELTKEIKKMSLKEKILKLEAERDALNEKIDLYKMHETCIDNFIEYYKNNSFWNTKTQSFKYFNLSEHCKLMLKVIEDNNFIVVRKYRQGFFSSFAQTYGIWNMLNNKKVLYVDHEANFFRINTEYLEKYKNFDLIKEDLILDRNLCNYMNGSFVHKNINRIDKSSSFDLIIIDDVNIKIEELKNLIPFLKMHNSKLIILKNEELTDEIYNNFVKLNFHGDECDPDIIERIQKYDRKYWDKELIIKELNLKNKSLLD